MDPDASASWTEGDKEAGALARLPATALIEGYAKGDFTPSEVIEDVIAALEVVDARCNVVVTPMYEQARTAAREATEAWRNGTATGSLAGVPVSVKDLVFVKDVPAAAGAPTLKDFVPAEDAAIVSALRAAGAVLTCKTTTCEAGYKLTADSPLSGVTRNPWRLDRTSGGSSGGAAAGVAAGAGPLAVGTDAVGSIRVPSSFCGVFGIKPTFGLVPRAPGFFPPSWGSLAHTGPIGRTVADVALMLEVMAGYDSRDAVSLPQPPRRFMDAPDDLSGVRIAFSPDFGYAAIDPEVRSAFETAVVTLAGLGAEMIDDRPTIEPDILEQILKPIGYTEQASAVNGRPEAELALSEPEFVAVVKSGRVYRGTDYMDATHRRAQLRKAFHGLFQRVDALVTPTVAVTAFAAGTIGVDEIDGVAVDRHLGWSPFSWPINLAGLPAASIPCGFDSNGLPIGLQVVAPWLDEPRIFAIARAFEAAAPWADRWPGFTGPA
ncbi:MAG: amidase [Rhodospirillaceae bacterium]|nr:amidase [Rhodospirillaceae bacterium]